MKRTRPSASDRSVVSKQLPTPCLSTDPQHLESADELLELPHPLGDRQLEVLVQERHVDSLLVRLDDGVGFQRDGDTELRTHATSLAPTRSEGRCNKEGHETRAVLEGAMDSAGGLVLPADNLVRPGRRRSSMLKPA